MRLFLLPISTRRSLIYCQRILEENGAPRSYGYRISTKLAQTWKDWEKEGNGWKKYVTVLGDKVLAQIPYQESGLKTIPPLTSKRRRSMTAGAVTPNVDVLFPSNFVEEGKVLDTLKRLPNIPLFYILYRASAHWRAYRGSKHLELLLEKNAINPCPSTDLDKIYAAGLPSKSAKGIRVDPSPTNDRVDYGQSSPGSNLDHDTGDTMLLQPSSSEMIADHFNIPNFGRNIQVAVQQVCKMIARNEGTFDDEEPLVGERKPTRIGLAFKWFMLSIPVCVAASLTYIILDNTIGEKWRALKQARAPRKRPRYSPLRAAGDIRLLILKAGKDNEGIVCELRHANLRDSPQFEAVSYVWGTSLACMRIICDGKDTDIGVNLYEALEYLRLPDRDRVLWADALCINQDDIKERTHQVRQMGSVYSAADRVVIWLGKETWSNHGAFRMIANICANYPVDRWVNEAREVDYLASVDDWADWETDFKTFFQSLAPTHLGTSESQPSEQTDPDALIPEPIRTEPIAELLRHPWFRRIWVTQELASAKSAVIVCGREELPWNVFKGTIDFLWPIIPHQYAKYSYHLGMPPADTLIARKNLLTMHLMRSKYQSRTSGHTLLDLVLLTRGFECSDPRDKIFALVGIAKDVEPTDWEVAPDYSRSVEDVYKQFALWSITKRRDLQVLSLTPDPLVPPKLSLPSWVPDLTRANNAEPLPVMSNLPSSAPFEESWTQRLKARWKRRDVFHADRKARFSFRSQPRVSLSGNNNELHIAGREVDSIKEVGSVANFAMVPYYNPNTNGDDDTAGTHYTGVNSWLSETLMITTGGAGALPYAAFSIWWPTLSAGMDAGGKLLSSKWRYAFTVAASGLGFSIPDYGWRRFLLLDGFFELRRPALATWRLRNYHEPAIIRWSQFRRFCSTVDGRLGLVPGGAAPGDIVCILEGARVPYILRPNADGSYKVQGYATASVEVGLKPTAKLFTLLSGHDKIYYPNSATYDARIESYWSASAALEPWCMVLPTTAQETSEAIRTIAAKKRPFGIRSGGHSLFPLSSSVEDGVTIDFGKMNATTFHADSNIVSIQPGGNRDAVYEALAPHGVVVAGGRGSVNFEVVLADGSTVNASARENRDLWIALKGGSGNFGLVIRFDLGAIPYADPQDPVIWGGAVVWHINATDGVIDAIVEFANNVAADVYSSSVYNWAGSPRGQREGWLLACALHNVVNRPSAPAFDGYMAMNGLVGQTLRSASMSNLTVEQDGAAGYRNVNDARVLRFAVHRHKELARRVNETIPDDAARNTLLQLQPVAEPMVSQGKGLNSLGLEDEVANGPGILTDLLVQISTPEAEAAIYPIAIEFQKAVDDYAASIGAGWEWRYLNYADRSVDPIARYGKRSIDRLQAVSASTTRTACSRICGSRGTSFLRDCGQPSSFGRIPFASRLR
ncbi:hypothetical protein DL770_004631 [Monosporascus sp. CRB-9-2]|nr:hypothetical protein DL770_004631 [Monosporascus sp. CRB-9-2]